MSIRYASGDLLSAPVEAVVNTVNTRGVMGKGIALQVKQRWPEVERAYRAASKRGEVVLGKMHVVERGGLGDGPQFVINFPTKDHWRSRSKLADISAGLDDLRTVIMKLGITSVAVPPLGCGYGGLRWADVQPLIAEALDSLDSVEVVVYPPEATPDPAQMEVGTKRPSLSPTLAGLVCLLDRYVADVLGITDIEVQKLAYFLGVRRPELRLEFTRGHYGPYCESLQHVLVRAEGHYLRGYGDRTRRPWETSQLTVLPGTAEAAGEVAARLPGMILDIDAVFDLIEGYEGARSMELLSTVHWVARESGGATSPAEARAVIARWSDRKNRLFPLEDIDEAWNRLAESGWLEEPTTAPTLF